MNIKRMIKRLGRKCYLKKVRLQNKNKDFTIIAQNCIGGVIYSNLGVPFLSPTINMFIEGDNFVKLVERLDYYMQIQPVPVTDCFVDPIDNNIQYPVIRVDDVRICCLHYKDCNDAIIAWNRRRKRVNLNNVYVIANSWNCHEDKDIITKISNCKYPTVIFCDKEMNIDNCVVLKGDCWHLDERGILRPNITDEIPGHYLKYFEKMFDYVGFLNNK